MANYAALKAAIVAAIKQNGNNEITGNLLQQQLLAMVNSLGVGYQFVGVATPETDPGTPDQNVFYITSTSGTYANFNGIVLNEYEIAILLWNGTWQKHSIFANLNSLTFDLPIVGKYLTTTGTEQSGSNFSCSNFIRIEKNDKITISGWCGNYLVLNIAGYDENKQFVSGLLNIDGAASNETIIIPDNVKYIRVCLANEMHVNYIPVFIGVSIDYYKLGNLFDLPKQVAINTKNIGISEYLTDGSEITTSPDNGFAPFQNAIISFVDDYFVVDCSQPGIFVYPGIRNNLLAGQLVAAGKGFEISFWARYKDGSQICPFYLSLKGGDIIYFDLNGEWAEYRYKINENYLNNIDRIQLGFDIRGLQSVTNLGFEIKNLVVSFDGSISGRVSNLEDITPNPLKGKKIAVIGDSISTIYDNNTPYWTVKNIDVGNTIESFVTWWDVWVDESGTIPTNKSIGGVTLTNEMIGTKQQFVPILDDVGKQIGVAMNYNPDGVVVWSQRLCEKAGATLLANASWSGSRITTGRTGAWVLSEAWNDYTIGRCKGRDDNGNDIMPDVIFIFRGGNDYQYSPIAHIDDISLMNGVPESDTINSVVQYKAGYYKTIQKLRAAYPKAFIVCCVLSMIKRGSDYSTFPPRNDIYTLPEMCDAIREIANTMGCGLVEFDKDGITFENIYPTYANDSAERPTHPNNTGHEVMAQRAFADMKYCLQL